MRAARDSEYVLVIVGTSDIVESEGYDRTDLELPDGQNELIEQVLDVNPRTVVIVNSGGPVAMPWLPAAPAVLQAWFGGQSMGDALADVLDGADAPGGRMPFTIPLKIQDTPTFGNFPGESGSLRYGEGLLIGHRWYDTRQLDVAVPFGAGRSYTTFEWSDIRLSSTAVDADESVAVELTIENTGRRPGSDVVQIYVTPPAATPLFRPARELKGFTKVHLEPGERRSVVIELDWRAFAYWTPENRATYFHDQVRATPFASTVPNRVPMPGWTVVDGNYLVVVSRSVKDVVAELALCINDNIEGRR